MYLVKDEHCLCYMKKNFEKMTNRKYEYVNGLNGHYEITLYVDI